MGASGWQYVVPYEADYQLALDRLRADVFHRGDYHWPWEDDWVEPDERRPRPNTMAELLGDELIGTEGTHSIIDCARVFNDAPATDAAWSSVPHGTVIPVTDAELVDAVGTDRPTVQHLDLLDQSIARMRWVGRCAVLHSASGEPEQLAFWGHSGD